MEDPRPQEADAAPQVVISKGAENRTAAETRGAYSVDEHLLSPQEVAARFKVQVNWDKVSASPGLTSAQVEDLRSQHGRNMLTPPKQLPEFVKLLLQFTNPLLLLLLMAGGLLFLVYGIQDPRDRNNLILAIALVSVVSITCVMSWWQERSASNVMDSLKSMLPSKTSVYRDGREQKVDAADLVPGDVVRLQNGDRVPADIRIIESADLKVECSSLTGESDLVPATVDRKGDSPEHAGNLVFMSSLCMNGEGWGIVVHTGDNTMIGKIASLAGGTGNQQSSLQREVHRLVVFVGSLGFCLAVALFVIGVARGVDPLEAFINGFIITLVANVPEGLPASVTSLLTLTAQRLKERNVLIKRSDIIENLGSASIIASDKTGTLTQNKMTVENIWCNNELRPAGAFLPPPRHPVANQQSMARLARNSAAAGNTSLNKVSRRILEKTSRPLAPGHVQLTSAASNAGSLPATTSGGRLSPTLAHQPVGAAHATHQRQQFPSAFAADGAVAMAAADPPGGHIHKPVGPGLAPVKEGVLADDQSGGRGLEFVLSPALMSGAAQEVMLARMSLGRTSTGFDENGCMTVKTVGSMRRGSTELIQKHSLGVPSSQPHDGASLALVEPSRADLGWAQMSAFTRLTAVATVCNKARFLLGDGEAAGAVAAPGSSEPKIQGDATDTGLLRYCARLVDSEAVRARFRIVFSIPFNSTNKWSAVVTPCPGTSTTDHLLMLKGAPEMVVAKCSTYLRDGDQLPVDEAFKASMQEACERCGFMGERVLGFAYKVVPASTEAEYQAQQKADVAALTGGLVFAGLVSLVDPPRPGVLEAVQRCRTAGIRVAMVTGDHPLTAEAIARKVGIVTLATRREVAAESGVEESQIKWDDPRVGAVVVTGADIRGLQTNEQWDEVLDHEEVVFARTSPQQKLQIVEHLQRRGEVVAVTGDGVNDSPALKRAQIGVAMGQGGSDVARDAADIILLDDEFPSIVSAIEEGRVIFDNLKKTVGYTLTHIFPEIFPIFLNMALGFPLGLGGLLILAIDLVTEQGPAISLAYEKPEGNVMARPPRDVEVDRLIDRQVLTYAYGVAGITQGFACMMAFFTIFWWHGVSVTQLFQAVDNKHFTSPPEEARPLEVDWSCAPGEALPSGTTCVNGNRVYDGERQLRIFWEAQAAWFINLIMAQFWHIWMCKTRQVSIFKHGLFRNPFTIGGTFISIFVAILLVYIPELNDVFFTYSLHGIGWLPNLIFLLVLLPYTEFTKAAVRSWSADPNSTHPAMGWWARKMAW